MRAAFAVALALVAASSAAAATCNDIHIIGVTAVNQAGTPQGVFDKMLGEVLCVRVQLIEIDTDMSLETPADYDVHIRIVNSNGQTVSTCCWAGEASPGNAVPFYLLPPAWECCYVLSPSDPIGTYTIHVGIMQNAVDCEAACVPGSWNHTVVQVTGVVPVELSSFEASVVQEGVIVRWETSSEHENLGFFVLRATSIDGEWGRLGEMIPAQGTSSTGASYSFVDRPPSPGVYFYRLEDVATDGTTTLHDPVRVTVGDKTSWGAVKASFDE